MDQVAYLLLQSPSWKSWSRCGNISFIKRKISTLHGSYRKLTKIPFARRQTESFKKNEDKFTKSLELLFDITLKSLPS